MTRSPKALHSADSGERYSPARVAELAKGVMGRIDLDPFSCELANKVIGAEYIFTQEDDGYAQEWGDGTTTVFCNPSGVKLKRKPERSPKAISKPGQVHGWWKMLDEYDAGRVEQAIFVCFNMNLFQTSQSRGLGYAPPFRFPFCIPRRRPRYWCEDFTEEESSPGHASAIVYLPPRLDPALSVANRHTFWQLFSELGEVRL